MGLLEDLDINMEEIKGNLKSVIFFKQFEEKFVKELDMIGPLGIYLLLAFSQTLVRVSDSAEKASIQLHIRILDNRHVPDLPAHQPDHQAEVLLAVPHDEQPRVLARADRAALAHQHRRAP